MNKIFENGPDFTVPFKLPGSRDLTYQSEAPLSPLSVTAGPMGLGP